MKNLELTFESRLKITALLGLVRGSLDKVTALQSIWLQTRFDDAESSQIKTVDLGNGISNYVPPAPDWGAKTIPLEDSYAAALLKELEECQTFGVSDVSWVKAVKKQLA